MFLSCCNQATGEVDCDMLKLIKLDREAGALIFAADIRSDFYANVTKSMTACVNVYFPLSKEKLKLTGAIQSLSSKCEES